ncbi:hypothetical protein EAE99_005433 [Botrytis elliptica]|nr:hypothetical protein EAE99_005433 [Botrytis elliptica]
MLDGIESANERQGRLFRILEAFLTPSYVARLRTILSDQVKNDESYLKNLWLLTSSFSEGHVAINLKPYRGIKRFEEEEMYGLYRLFPEDWYNLFLGDGTEWEYNILFTQKFTPDVKRLPLPSCHLFEVHSRFATASYQFFVIDKISKARVYCYHYLVRFGRWLHGPTGAVLVARAPFRLYIEQITSFGIDEPNALKLIEQCTFIPAPRFVDVAEHGDENYLVVTLVRDSTPARALGEENVPRNHRPVFPHSDLHWSNILVDQGKVFGIIDWKCVGFLPEYWEFTKAM